MTDNENKANENDKNVKSKKTVFRRITGIVGYTLIFIIAALLVVVMGFKMTNQTVFIFGKAAVWVLTPSMEPDIPARSYILVNKVDAKDVEEGDIIMFRSKELNGANNTHQVIKIEGDHELFYTKGIANPAPDKEPTEAKDVVAIYEKNLPVMTAVGRFIMSRIGIVVSLTVIFAIIMIIYTPDIIRATRKKSAELEKKRQAKIDELVREEVERIKREKEEETYKPAQEEKAAEETALTEKEETITEEKTSAEEENPEQKSEKEIDTSDKED